MVTKEELVKYLSNAEVWIPTSTSSRGKSYSIQKLIPNLSESVAMLYAVIEKTTDPTLDRLEIDFHLTLDNIINFKRLETLPKYTEDLSQLYESFLKKIGHILYTNEDQKYFYGDAYTAGINKTSLDALNKWRTGKY